MDTPPRFRWFVAGCVVLALMGLTHAVAANLNQDLPPGEDWVTFDRLYRSLVVPGVGHTMEQIELGFGWFFSLASVVMGAAGLSLLPLARREPGIVRRLAVVYGVGCAAALAISLRHWFFIPTSFLSASLVLFIVSALRDGRVRPASTGS